ncbi:MAG TPA: hypothetical protein VFT55_13335, partial [Planctomycetota bacterium]|nr:hypothetical protein [Planctomycetota bacterium]
YEAEERLEWDSSVEDKLPKRIKIEFTIERRRSNRAVVNDLEIDDFEGAEKSYVRHFVFDHRLDNILQAGTARVPVLPPEPTAEGAGGQGPGPGGGGGGGGGGGDGRVKQTFGSGEQPHVVGQPVPGGRNPGQMTTTQGRRPGTQPSGATMPPGFDLGRFLSGLGGGGGGGGGGGLFGGR